MLGERRLLGVEERGGAELHHACRADLRRRVEHVAGADHVDGLVLARDLGLAAEHRRRVDHVLAAVGGGQHRVGVGDVAAHDVDAERLERPGLAPLAHQGAHGVALVDELLGDVGADHPGRAGEEDPAHVSPLNSGAEPRSPPRDSGPPG